MKRLLLGPHAVAEALRAGPRRIAVVYAAQQSAEILEAAERAGVRTETRSRDELDVLARGQRHQGVVGIAGEYSYTTPEAILQDAGSPALVLALDQITDPHNFGAIVRSAVALGADGLITLRDRAAPVTPAVVRVSAGATEAARIARVVNLKRALSALREAELQVVGLDAEGERTLSEVPYPATGRVLVVGSEGKGLRRGTRQQCDILARIPLPGPLQSLNASVAAGIAIHESVRARRELSDGNQTQDQDQEAGAGKEGDG